MSKVEKSRDKFLSKINKNYVKALKKIALTPIESKISNINQYKGGRVGFDVVAHTIETNEGVNIHSHTIVMYFTAHGLARAVLHEPARCYCGTVIGKPIPSTIIFKRIKSGLRKKPFFIPYGAGSPSAKRVLESKMNWNPLVDALNQDDGLLDSLSKLPTGGTIAGIDASFNTGKRMSLDMVIDDRDDNTETVCQIIPMDDRTLIATHHIAQDLKSIENAVKAISRIHKIVDDYNYDKPMKGPMPQQWGNDVLKLIGHETRQRPEPPMEEPEPAKEPERTIKEEPSTPPHGGGEKSTFCPRCGHENPQGNKFCNNCGSLLTPQEIECPKCGHKNDPTSKFCGGCGASLEPSKEAETPAQPTPPTSVQTDPIEQKMSQVKERRDAKWSVHLKFEGKLTGWDLWNYWDMKYSVPVDTFMKPIKKIQDHKHYEMNRSFEYITDPLGTKSIGGYFLMATKFKKKAPKPLRNKQYQMLFLGRDETREMRLIGAKERGLTLDIIDLVIQEAANNPRNLEYVIYFTMKDYSATSANARARGEKMLEEL